MIEVLITQFLQASLLVSTGVMIALYVVIITQWPRWQRSKSFLKNYQGVQRVHEGEVPRLGGLVIYIGLWVYWLLCQHGKAMPFIQCLLISSLPLIFISVKEDLQYNTRAITRLGFMIASCILFFLCYDITFPSIEFPVIGDWLANSSLLSLLFFSFCVLVITNGSNLIDGANGLLPMSVLMQVLCLMFITYESNDSLNMIRLVYVIVPVIIFMGFNFPWGKIFLGDTGAYFLGFMLSLLTIIIFSEHPEIPTWVAVLILFYPAFELLFSIIRKLIEHKSPMEPDPHHLHLKMFHLLKNQVMKSRVSNSLVMPCLALIWGMPFILLVWVKDNLIMTLLGIVVIIIIYLGFYWALPRKKN
ncbi:MraY family glycosyltransferase [Methylophilaceae bacterium]|nr:MraY family glycosyltransferase [Methylophilaceae bacterium]